MKQLRHLGGEAELFCQLRIERRDGRRGPAIGGREFGLRGFAETARGVVRKTLRRRFARAMDRGLAAGAAVPEIIRGGCSPVPDPSPLSPRLIAALSSSASARSIGCTSGRWALEFGTLARAGRPACLDFFESGGLAIRRIWSFERRLSSRPSRFY
jgi:hypothetical protein